ncbi:helix-turn-helix domain-containing protein [Bradyrhizobium sp. URHC0002]
MTDLRTVTILCHQAERGRHVSGAGRFPLSEIALRSGFSSQASFTRTFRRATNMTPGEFRQHGR